MAQQFIVQICLGLCPFFEAQGLGFHLVLGDLQSMQVIMSMRATNAEAAMAAGDGCLLRFMRISAKPQNTIPSDSWPMAPTWQDREVARSNP